MSQLTLQQAFDLALQRHRAGQLSEAEQLYRQVLAQQPEHADAQMNLGNVLKDEGQLDEAIAVYRLAIALRPDHAESHSNLGNALRNNGQLDEAVDAYRRAIALKPDLPEIHNNLGIALKKKGRLEEAVAAYRQAIALRPTYAKAHSNLGIALRDMGQLDEAIAAYRQAIALRPNFPEAHNNLGIALKQRGQLDESIAAFRKAVALRPGYADAFSNLGNALRDKGQLDQAIAACRKAIALNPNLPEAHNNLGHTWRAMGRMDEALAAYRQAIELKPNYGEAYSNVGHVLKDQGRLDEAIAAYREAMSLRPHVPEAHSDVIFAMLYHPGCNARTIDGETRRWNSQYAEPLKKLIKPHSSDRDPERRLRIGYLSPDFRSHVVGRNLLPLFQHHDHRQFEIFCYAHVIRPDALTRRFQQSADHWYNGVGKRPDQVIDQIRADQIDILVDLSLHMSGTLLMFFAIKLAPVQVTFGGYPGGTGMEAMDFRLTDPYLDPPHETDQYYVEKSVRLADSFWCYDPNAMDAPTEPVNPLPALQNGFITFGCLNNFTKVSDQALGLWSGIMKSLPNSRLIILSPHGEHRSRVLSRLDVEPRRVEFVPLQQHATYMRTFHRIDLSLDTFPYNGHTTSLDSLWMGVPVVTLIGSTVVGRAGLSQLSNLGLTELVAQTPQQYVQIIRDLANDLPRLGGLRKTLRQRMLDSPLCDAGRFARNIEAAFRRMWRTWCEQS